MIRNIFNLKPKGFTLIELLVVISIIGVLGSTIYAPFNEARKKGRDAKRVSELNSLQSALILFSDSHNGCFPIDRKYAVATDYNNMLYTDNYKYVSKGLYDKVDDSEGMVILNTNTFAGIGFEKYKINPVNANKPYYYSVFGNGDCMNVLSGGTDYSNMYFSYYQLFVELETHTTALDGDADFISVIGGTYRHAFRVGGFYGELCKDDTTQKMDCIYDLSNY